MKDKLECLDGVRGIMAINVIICHFVCVYYPQMRYDTFAYDNNDVLSLFCTTPLSVLVNGNIAVQYFFVLTGFLTFRSVYYKCYTRREIGQKAVLRYFRLWPMVFLATTITFLSMVLHLQFHLEIYKQVANSEFLLDYCNFTPTFLKYVSNVFIMPFVRNSDFVGPFWTIRYEMWGYVLSLLFAFSIKDTKWKRVLIAFGIIVLYFCNIIQYIPFLMGGELASILYINDDERLRIEKIYDFLSFKPVLLFLALVGVYFACCPVYFTSIYYFWGVIPRLKTSLLRAFGCSILMYCLLNSHVLQKILSIKPLTWWGGVSFAAYSIHWPIMLSLQSWLFMLFHKNMGYDKSAILSFVISIPFIVLSSMLLNKLEFYISNSNCYKRFIESVNARI